MSVTFASACLEQLEPRRLFAAASVVDAADYCLADLNGDAKADMARVAKMGLRLATGNGDGTFEPAQTVNLPAQPTTVLPGDFNNDGKGDLLAPMSNGIIAILVGLQSTPTPNEPLVGPPSFWDHGDGSDVVSKNTNIEVGDVNADGKDDLIVVNAQRGVITVYTAQFSGQETFTYLLTTPSPFGARVRVSAGDVNGDGQADLVGLDTHGNVDAYLWTGVGPDAKLWTGGPHSVVSGTGTHGANTVNRVVVGNVKTDDRDEVLVFADAGIRLGYYVGDSSGGVWRVVNVNVGPLSRALQRGLAVGDINGDGHDDLFAINSAGQTRFFDIFAELP